MFGRIAGRYDLLNRVMTLGQDLRWRRQVIRWAELSPPSRLLDLGTGTGDLALEAVRQSPGLFVIAVDFTPEMMHLGRQRPGGDQVHWVAGDALHLPFATESLDRSVSAFLLRNVADLDRSLEEQHRVLRSGGYLVSLDTTPPPAGPWRPLVKFHLNYVIPLLGRLLAGSVEAYHYLSATTEGFLHPENLEAQLRTAGFLSIRFVRRMLGTIAIHRGQKG